MRAGNYADVRGFLMGFLAERLEAQGRIFANDLPDDYDLLLSGLLDSMGLLEMMTALQHEFGDAMDFELLDPEQISVVGPLCRFVAEQHAQRTS